jgi:lysylphosphatidylglycerol synthetase-like protein (DUF2156 family)
MGDLVIHHPNREKPESKSTKAVVTMLLLVSAAMVLLITIGGWAALQGAHAFALLYSLLNVVMAYYISRWNRGLLPVAAALAIFYAVLSAIASSSWFARDKPGLADPALDPALLGLLTLILIPIQALLVAFAVRGFRQQWNVELEVDSDDLRPTPAVGGGRPRASAV